MDEERKPVELLQAPDKLTNLLNDEQLEEIQQQVQQLQDDQQMEERGCL